LYLWFVLPRWIAMSKYCWRLYTSYQSEVLDFFGLLIIILVIVIQKYTWVYPLISTVLIIMNLTFCFLTLWMSRAWH
jgi:hypothetical protein